MRARVLTLRIAPYALGLVVGVGLAVARVDSCVVLGVTSFAIVLPLLALTLWVWPPHWTFRLSKLPEQVRRAEKVSALDIAIGVAIAAVLVALIPVLCED